MSLLQTDPLPPDLNRPNVLALRIAYVARTLARDKEVLLYVRRMEDPRTMNLAEIQAGFEMYVEKHLELCLTKVSWEHILEVFGLSGETLA